MLFKEKMYFIQNKQWIFDTVGRNTDSLKYQQKFETQWAGCKGN